MENHDQNAEISSADVFPSRQLTFGEWLFSFFRSKSEDEKQSSAARKVLKKITGVKPRHLKKISKAGSLEAQKKYLDAVYHNKKLDSVLECQLVGEGRKGLPSLKERCLKRKLTKLFDKKGASISEELSSLDLKDFVHQLALFSFRHRKHMKKEVDKLLLIHGENFPESLQKGWGYILGQLENGNPKPFQELMHFESENYSPFHNFKIQLLGEVIGVDKENLIEQAQSMEPLDSKLSEWEGSNQDFIPMPPIVKKGPRYLVAHLKEGNYQPLYSLLSFLGAGTLAALPPVLLKVIKKLTSFKGKEGEDLGEAIQPLLEKVANLQSKQGALDEAKYQLQQKVEGGLSEIAEKAEANDLLSAEELAAKEAAKAGSDEGVDAGTAAAVTTGVAAAAAVAQADAYEEENEEEFEQEYEEPVEEVAEEEPVEEVIEEEPEEEIVEEEVIEEEPVEEIEPVEEVAEEEPVEEVVEEEPEEEVVEEEQEEAGAPGLDEVSPYIERSNNAIGALKEGENRIPVVVDGELQITEGDDVEEAQKGFSYIAQVIDAGVNAGAPKQDMLQMITDLATLPQAQSMLSDEQKQIFTNLYQKLSG